MLIKQAPINIHEKRFILEIYAQKCRIKYKNKSIYIQNVQKSQRNFLLALNSSNLVQNGSATQFFDQDIVARERQQSVQGFQQTQKKYLSGQSVSLDHLNSKARFTESNFKKTQKSCCENCLEALFLKCKLYNLFDQ